MRPGSHGFDDGIGYFPVTVQRGEHVAEHLYGPHCDRVHDKLKVRGAGMGQPMRIMRGLVEPSIKDGPPGRAGPGSSTQSSTR
jgi:hypothetical protein